MRGQEKWKKGLLGIAVFVLALLFLGPSYSAHAKTVTTAKNVTLVQGQATKYKIVEKKKLKIYANSKNVEAVNKEMKWTSSNPKLATVSANGTIRTLGSGSVTIKGVLGKKAVKLKLNIVKPKISSEEYALYKNADTTLTVSNTAKATVKWESSKKTVATVSKGKVTAKAAGTTVISAKVGGVYTCKCTVTVLPIKVKAASRVMLPGDSESLLDGTEVYATGYSKAQAIWTSQDTAVAVVKSNGKVTAAGLGTTTVTMQVGPCVRTFPIVVSLGGKWIAHRGHSGTEPENTIASFITAGSMGAWGIETDIRNTIDGEIVLMHDGTLDRTTSGTGYLSKLTFAQLRNLDEDYLEENEGQKIYVNAGKRIDDYEGYEPLVPTLDEYLDICSQYGCVAVIELKGFTSGKYADGTSFTDKDMYRKLYQSIKAHGMLDQCRITSTVYDRLKDYLSVESEFDKKLELTYIVSVYNDTVIAQAKELNAALNISAAALTSAKPADVVKKLRSNGLEIGIWNLKTKQNCQTWYEAGADFLSYDTLLPTLQAGD